MKNRHLLALGLAGHAVAGCSAWNFQRSEDFVHVETASSALSVALSDAELADKTNSAIDGDPDAALAVALHYEALPVDNDVRLHWLRIAAENGSPTAMQHLAVHLYDDGHGGHENCRRATYWLRKIEKSDHDHLDVGVLLQEISIQPKCR